MQEAVLVRVNTASAETNLMTDVAVIDRAALSGQLAALLCNKHITC